MSVEEIGLSNVAENIPVILFVCLLYYVKIIFETSTVFFVVSRIGTDCPNEYLSEHT